MHSLHLSRTSFSPICPFTFLSLPPVILDGKPPFLRSLNSFLGSNIDWFHGGHLSKTRPLRAHGAPPFFSAVFQDFIPRWLSSEILSPQYPQVLDIFTLPYYGVCAAAPYFVTSLLCQVPSTFHIPQSKKTHCLVIPLSRVDVSTNQLFFNALRDCNTHSSISDPPPPFPISLFLSVLLFSLSEKGGVI